MQIEIFLAFLLLVGLSLLATVDMAFGQLSDVGLRRLITEAQESAKLRSSDFLKQVLENRPQIHIRHLGDYSDSTGRGRRPRDLDLLNPLSGTALGSHRSSHGAGAGWHLPTTYSSLHFYARS